jgi:hypothetical protein
VRPVGCGESFRRLIAKTVLLAVGAEATAACDNLNLCASLKAGIEGAVHALQDACQKDLDGERPHPYQPPPLPTPPTERANLDGYITQPDEVSPTPTDVDDGRLGWRTKVIRALSSLTARTPLGFFSSMPLTTSMS